MISIDIPCIMELIKVNLLHKIRFRLLPLHHHESTASAVFFCDNASCSFIQAPAAVPFLVYEARPSAICRRARRYFLSVVRCERLRLCLFGAAGFELGVAREDLIDDGDRLVDLIRRLRNAAEVRAVAPAEFIGREQVARVFDFRRRRADVPVAFFVRDLRRGKFEFFGAVEQFRNAAEELIARERSRGAGKRFQIVGEGGKLFFQFGVLGKLPRPPEQGENEQPHDDDRRIDHVFDDKTGGIRSAVGSRLR